MIGLDTNVLVRYIVRDDPAQTDIATRWIETHCTVNQPGFISLIVLAELVWVLARAYRYEKPLIVKVLSRLLIVKELIVEEVDLARAALYAYETGNADFADYLIGSTNKSKGCLTTVTFDRRATHSSWHSLLE